MTHKWEQRSEKVDYYNVDPAELEKHLSGDWSPINDRFAAVRESQKTTFLPQIKPQAPVKMRQATESEKLKEARNRGITFGVALMAGLIAACLAGVGVGSFLMRVLVF